jgi:hypothetical protein
MTVDRDKPIACEHGLQLDRLADDEVDMLAGVVDAVKRRRQPVPIGKQYAILDSILRKLTAERERRGLPPWEPGQ